MKTIDIKTTITVCQTEDLDTSDRELIEQAIAATKNAYAEYSHFRVGASVRLANGKTVIGANQENAAFPSSLCAERPAIFAAQAQYPDQPITAIAIAARKEDGFLAEPISPCGACRQVMLGIEDRYKHKMKVLLYGENGIYCLSSASELLPLSFIDSSMR